MKFSLSPDPAGDYVSRAGRRLQVVPATTGKDFADEASFAAAFDLVPLPLYAARQTRLSVLAAKLAQPVTVSGITLAVDADTQTQLNHLITGLTLARDQQPDDTHRAAFLTAEVSTVTGPILDAQGNSHDMPVSQVFGLILGYFQAYGAVRGAYLAAVAAVAAATTVAEVQAV